jgi:hypothetical protein
MEAMLDWCIKGVVEPAIEPNQESSNSRYCSVMKSVMGVLDRLWLANI